MDSITEVYTVIDANGRETWSSGPNDETPGAADSTAQQTGGQVLRAMYVLANVEKLQDYRPQAEILARRNEIWDMISRAEHVMGEDGSNEEDELLSEFTDFLRSLVDEITP